LRLEQLPGHTGGGPGDFPDAGEHDAVGHVAFARDRFVIRFHTEAVRQRHHHSERARRRADFSFEPVFQFHSILVLDCAQRLSSGWQLSASSPSGEEPGQARS